MSLPVNVNNNTSVLAVLAVVAVMWYGSKRASYAKAELDIANAGLEAEVAQQAEDANPLNRLDHKESIKMVKGIDFIPNSRVNLPKHDTRLDGI